jgi:hypothetical protein
MLVPPFLEDDFAGSLAFEGTISTLPGVIGEDKGFSVTGEESTFFVQAPKNIVQNL